jgi:hypothetical protein
MINQSILLVFHMQIAELVASEFFEQGDYEREKLNMVPIVRVQFHMCLIRLSEFL